MEFSGVLFQSNLTVGGIPATRSLLRVAMPHGIRDSTQIVRATLYLVPVAPAFGTVADSFFVRAARVGAGPGEKSLSVADTFGVNSIALGAGASDTVRLEVTSLVRLRS